VSGLNILVEYARQNKFKNILILDSDCLRNNGQLAKSIRKTNGFI
jgi:hypothetical protein